MSIKEKAIKLLRERYSESFAVTSEVRERQVHLFLIKGALWALVWTFSSRDLEITPQDDNPQADTDRALRIIECAMTGENPEMENKLQVAVLQALDRIALKMKTLEFSR